MSASLSAHGKSRCSAGVQGSGEASSQAAESLRPGSGPSGTVSESGTVLALSGRRIDAAGAPERFPLRNRSRVEGLIREAMIDAAAETLVSSAACGSDLLALKAAGDLGIRRRVILPFDQATFRDQSVVDRPGDWGPLFDRILSEVGSAGDLTLLGLRPSDRFAYEETNRAILSEGEARSRWSTVASASRWWCGTVRRASGTTIPSNSSRKRSRAAGPFARSCRCDQAP